MDEIKQTQRAEEGSTLVQAGTVTVNNNTVVGITEQRAREIFSEEMAKRAQCLAVEAQDIATKRMLDLFSDLMARVKKCEKDLSAFSDPGFIQNLRIAQESAAVSERKEDIETLSELLLARMNGALKRTTKTGIRKAMEIVPELEEAELMVLSFFLFYSKYNLTNTYGTNSEQYLHMLNESFSKLLPIDLPQGKKWIQHLAILDVVMVDPASHFVSIEEFFVRKSAGIVCVGIEKGSQGHQDAIAVLENCGIGAGTFVDNDLFPGFVRLPIVDPNMLSAFPAQIQNTTQWVLLNPEIKYQDSIKKVFSLYDKDENKMNQVKQKFLEVVSKYQSLLRVNNWISAIEPSFELTSVGEALAYVNARRCIPDLPILELE